MVFTLNEEYHLPRCLDALSWCDDIVVVDSFSTDRTKEICRERGVRFVQHAFEGFGSQRSWALDNVPLSYPWVLVLDADEMAPPELAEELGKIAVADPPDFGAYRVRRRFYMWGRWLRYSSLYPTWVVRVARHDRIRYVNRGHAETQEVKGRIGDLEHDLLDENLKGVDEWFERQNRYARRDAEHELALEGKGLQVGELLSGDPLTRRTAMKRLAGRLPFRGVLYFLYSYVWRGGFRDGRDGFMFCLMRSMYQTMVAVKKHDAKRRLSRAGREAE